MDYEYHIPIAQKEYGAVEDSSNLSGARCSFAEFQEQRILALENKILHSFSLEVGSYVSTDCRERLVPFLVTCGSVEENVQNVFEERAAR